tara:strand:+ start:213 stop:323 length:111 start_codon:yes stop_codon:yes gene_type:complete
MMSSKEIEFVAQKLKCFWFLTPTEIKRSNEIREESK